MSDALPVRCETSSECREQSLADVQEEAGHRNGKGRQQGKPLRECITRASGSAVLCLGDAMEIVGRDRLSAVGGFGVFTTSLVGEVTTDAYVGLGDVAR